MWNRGIAFSNTSCRLAAIQDFTSSTTTLDVWGSHAYGIDTANGAISIAAMRLGNGQPIAWLNQAGTANLPVLQMGVSNTIEIGNGAQPQVVFAVTSSIAPQSDNGVTSGVSGARWNSVWAANGAIQTSDPSMKTDIAPLPSMLPLVQALDPITFRWKSGGVVPVEVQRDVEVHATETYTSDEGAVEIAISSPQDPTIAKQGRVVGINTDRGLVICERAILVTSLMQRLNVTVLDGRSPVYGRDDRACRNVRRRWWARRLLPVRQ